MKDMRFRLPVMLLAMACAAVANPADIPPDIQITFDQHKGKFASMFSRAQRSKPGLQGKLKIEFTVSPGGQPETCRVVSSTLGEPGIEDRICGIILGIQFNRRPQAVTVIKEMDFYSMASAAAPRSN